MGPDGCISNDLFKFLSTLFVKHVRFNNFNENTTNNCKFSVNCSEPGNEQYC